MSSAPDTTASPGAAAWTSPGAGLRERGFELFAQVNTYESSQPRNVYREASNDVVFAQLWTRPGLTRRQRRWITLTATGLNGATHPTSVQVYSALNSNDISAEEMGEFLLHLACYAGFPPVADLDAALAQALERIAAERGQPLPEAGTHLAAEPFDALLERARQTRRDVLGGGGYAATKGSPMAEWFATAFEFGQVWSRPQLARGDRRLITLTCLAIQGADDLLREHLRAGLDGADLDGVDLGEFALHAAFYAGLAVGLRIDGVAAEVAGR